MFSGGKLLGTFKAPATRGQIVEIQSANRWENKFGRYLIIQMNFGNAKNFLHLEEAFALGIVAPSKMAPAAASLSTTYKHFYAKKCINGITTGSDLCHSKRERAPWLALDFGKGAKVSLEKVVLFNRREGCCWTRTKNVQIRLSNELPRSGRKLFLGGKLLGTFKGPGTRGQRVEIQSAIGWENKFGRFLVVQISEEKGVILNLREVIAIGVFSSKGVFNLLQLLYFILFPSEWISAENVFSDTECPTIGSGSKVSVAACQVLGFHCCSARIVFSRNRAKKQEAAQLLTGGMEATTSAS